MLRYASTFAATGTCRRKGVCEVAVGVFVILLASLETATTNSSRPHDSARTSLAPVSRAHVFPRLHYRGSRTQQQDSSVRVISHIKDFVVKKTLQYHI
jgi:hypothetical protein